MRDVSEGNAQMISALAGIALLITPSTKTDVALSCTDPGHVRPYRVAAEWLDHPVPVFGDQLTGTPHGKGAYEVLQAHGWVFVRRADAVCVEVADHQSHFSPWFGSRHHRRDQMP